MRRDLGKSTPLTRSDAVHVRNEALHVGKPLFAPDATLLRRARTSTHLSCDARTCRAAAHAFHASPHARIDSRGVDTEDYRSAVRAYALTGGEVRYVEAAACDIGASRQAIRGSQLPRRVLPLQSMDGVL